MIRSILALGTITVVTAFAGDAEAREQIRIVGSSTVYPFATAVAEQFGKTTSFKTPVVESTGSGGGLKLFCAGVGTQFPDIANSSRRIKESEVDGCAKNGVSGIAEIKIGFDGIVIANSTDAPTHFDLTRGEVFLALAKHVPVDGKLVANPYQTWRQIDERLPDVRIEVMGPPPTSGTRDAFVELVMEEACKAFPEIAALKGDTAAHSAACKTVREDGAFIEAGENDNLIVQKLSANPHALGIFGYSFLDQNSDKVQGSLIDGVEPTFENIAAGQYPVSRAMYIYVKKAHADMIPGLRAYVSEFTSERAWGTEGYLADKGLIPLPDDERKAAATAARELSNLKM